MLQLLSNLLLIAGVIFCAFVVRFFIEKVFHMIEYSLDESIDEESKGIFWARTLPYADDASDDLLMEDVPEETIDLQTDTISERKKAVDDENRSQRSHMPFRFPQQSKGYPERGKVCPGQSQISDGVICR